MASFAEIRARTADACNVVVSTADMLIRRELGEQDEASLSAPVTAKTSQPSPSRAGPFSIPFHASCVPRECFSIANRAAPTCRALSTL
jgi:hypothetical protein